MQFILRAEDGPGSVREFPLAKASIAIGREAGNDLVLPDPQVSRRHARLDLVGDGVVVVDFGSGNGTRVNGVPISGTHRLSAGDLVQFGESTFRLLPSFAIAPYDDRLLQPSPGKRNRPPLPLIIGGILAAMLLCLCIGTGAIVIAARGDSDAAPTARPAIAQSAPSSATGQTAVRPTVAQANAGTGGAGGTFVGTVQLGYEISFTVSADGKNVSNVEARVLTRCNNKSTSEELSFLPPVSFPVGADGSFGGEGRYAEGGPIYRFSGQLRGNTASGTLQEESAGGGIICDTKRLTWEATR